MSPGFLWLRCLKGPSVVSEWGREVALAAQPVMSVAERS